MIGRSVAGGSIDSLAGYMNGQLSVAVEDDELTSGIPGLIPAEWLYDPW